MTAPATRTPVTAMPAAVRTAALTGSLGVCAGSIRLFGSVARPVRDPFGLAAPAAARRGLALVRAARGVRGGFAAGVSAASARTAAFSAAFAGRPAAAFRPESRFALRLPGRDLGRFPSTPSSSAMDGDSSSARSGYTGPVSADDKVVERYRLVDWLVSGNSALGRLTSLSVALLLTMTDRMGPAPSRWALRAVKERDVCSRSARA